MKITRHSAVPRKVKHRPCLHDPRMDAVG